MSQNYLQTLETPKLTIDTIAQQAVVIKKDITLPYYFKSNYGHLCKVVSKEYYMKVINSGTIPFICAGYTEYNLGEIGSGTPITEDEFEYAYSQALMYIQLIKENKEPSNEVDENEQIDRIMEDRREAI